MIVSSYTHTDLGNASSERNAYFERSDGTPPTVCINAVRAFQIDSRLSYTVGSGLDTPIGRAEIAGAHRRVCIQINAMQTLCKLPRNPISFSIPAHALVYSLMYANARNVHNIDIAPSSSRKCSEVAAARDRPCENARKRIGLR